MNISLRSVIGIFTVIDNDIYVLYDVSFLPTITCLDDPNISCREYLKANFKLDSISLKQGYTFTEKNDFGLVITMLYYAIIRYKDVVLKGNFRFIKLSSLDKSDIFTLKLIECLKDDLTHLNTIKSIYPGEFKIPDIQKLYENLYNTKLDRRNFRKKLINLNVLEDLSKMSSISLGRPAKLYRFKDTNEDKIIF